MYGFCAANSLSQSSPKKGCDVIHWCVCVDKALLSAYGPCESVNYILKLRSYLNEFAIIVSTISVVSKCVILATVYHKELNILPSVFFAIIPEQTLSLYLNRYILYNTGTH